MNPVRCIQFSCDPLSSITTFLLDQSLPSVIVSCISPRESYSRFRLRPGGRRLTEHDRLVLILAEALTLMDLRRLNRVPAVLSLPRNAL